MKEIKSLLPKEAKIARSCSTGYGEALLKAAFLLDEGEVETISHYLCRRLLRSRCGLYSGYRRTGYEMYPYQRRHRGQRPVKRSLLLRMRFFYRNLANSLNYRRTGFREGRAVCKKSHRSGNPVYVFMNSNVKQAQKEGRFRRGYFRRPCLLCDQKRAV